MKTSLVLLLLCTFGFGKDPLDKLIGKWKLEKVVMGDTPIYPEKHSFFVIINQTTLSYSDGCNRCTKQIAFVTDTSIKLDGTVGCTKMYCPRPYDFISDYQNYSGNYKLQDSILIITNDEGEHYLIKQ